MTELWVPAVEAELAYHRSWLMEMRHGRLDRRPVRARTPRRVRRANRLAAAASARAQQPPRGMVPAH